MEIKDLQQAVDDWVSNPNFSVKYFPPFEICAQITEEAGEVCREVAHLHGHKKKKEGEKTDGIESEIGDLLFVLACLANSHNIDMAKAFKKSLDKKNSRDSKRFLK